MSILIILIDQITKNYISQFPLDKSIEILPFLKITHLHNAGAAFGILQHKQYFLITVGIAVLIFVTLYKQIKAPIPKTFDLGFAFLIGGNLGNLFDRIFHGYVIDFITIPHWPTFNVADVSINIGIILILLHSLKKTPEESGILENNKR